MPVTDVRSKIEKSAARGKVWASMFVAVILSLIHVYGNVNDVVHLEMEALRCKCTLIQNPLWLPL